MKTSRAKATTAALLFALTLAGCGLSDMEARAVALADMPCSGVDAATGAWASHPFPISPDDETMGDGGTAGQCAWMRLESREQLTVEHDLGRTPAVVLVYLGFRPSGVGATLASGDLARIMAVDMDTVVLENRTGESFYLRLVVE